MHMEKEALERLREAESFIGSPVNDLFSDHLGLIPQPRQRWLDNVREILTANGITPENLPGPWHTKKGKTVLVVGDEAIRREKIRSLLRKKEE